MLKKNKKIIALNNSRIFNFILLFFIIAIYFSIGSIVMAATETKYASSHITGSFSNPENANGAQDGVWAGDLNSNTSVTSRWAMGDPSGQISGTQTVSVYAKKGSNSGTPTIAIKIYENGSSILSYGATNVTSTTGQTISVDFSASNFSNANNIEVEIVMTAAGGSPSARNSAQVDSITWTVNYNPPTTTLGNGTDPSNSTIGPGASATEIDRFSLVTNVGTDTVTGLTVTLAGNASAHANIANVEVKAINTFNALNATGAAKNWTGVAVNATNGDVYSAVDTGDIYKQTAGTGSFVALNATGATKSWSSVAVNSSNGDVYAAVNSLGDIYKQTAGTGSFTALNATGITRNWTGITVNPSNGDVFAAVYGGDIYKQTAGTGSFNALNATGATKWWTGLSVNPTNGDVFAAVYGGDIYKQNAGTGSFNALNATGATQNWNGISVNQTNGDLYASAYPIGIYKQTAGTGSFNSVGFGSFWQGVSVNSSNGDVYANSYNVDIFKQSVDSETLCSATPSSNTVALTSCGIAVITTPVDYRVMITPKSHAAMPAVPGASYSTTATVTSVTATNTIVGSDSGSATITVDNASPAGVTSAFASSGNSQVGLAWTNPVDSDFTTNGTVVVLRRASSAVADVPVEGTTYAVGNIIGTATVGCINTGSPPATSCTDTGLSNGTAYHYKIFTQDSRGNYDAGTVPTGSPVTPATLTTTLSTGTNPGDSIMAPSPHSGITTVNGFVLTTSAGTDAITSITVSLPVTGGIGTVSITNNTDTVLGSAGGGTGAGITSSTVIPITSTNATTGGTAFKVKITALSHANMPAVPGASYAITGVVTGWAGTNSTAGTDTSSTLTIDNLSPGPVTSATATAGNTVVDLSWTNPVDADYATTLILRKVGSAVTDVPEEGNDVYAYEDMVGESTVVSHGSGSSFQDVGLTNGTVYHYKIFGMDNAGNFSSTGIVPTGSPATPSAGGAPDLSLAHYRFIIDDGPEYASSFAAAEDTPVFSDLFIGDRIRLRFLVSNIGSGSAANINYRLGYASSSCTTWYAVPTDPFTDFEWTVDASSNVSDGTLTTDSAGLSNPSGKTFVPGRIMTSSNVTPGITLTNSNFTEISYSLRSTIYATPGLVYCFRLTNAGSTSNFTYTKQPQISVTSSIVRPEAGGTSLGGETRGTSVLRNGGARSGGRTTGAGSGTGPVIPGGGPSGGGGDVGFLFPFLEFFASLSSPFDVKRGFLF